MTFENAHHRIDTLVVYCHGVGIIDNYGYPDFAGTFGCNPGNTVGEYIGQ